MSYTLSPTPAMVDVSFSTGAAKGMCEPGLDSVVVHSARSPERARQWGGNDARLRHSLSPKLQPGRAHGPHPLSQPPIVAVPTRTPSPPSPTAIPLSPVNQTMQRRRFSFPVSAGTDLTALLPTEERLQNTSEAVDDGDWFNLDDHPKAVEKAAPTHSHHHVDQFWRGMLSQSVEVEGVGRVSVSRFMAEVWKRGGPNMVSERCLWSNVFTSLSHGLNGNSHAGLAQPTAEATLALQALYNVAIRPNEIAIFSGFLTSMAAAETTSDFDNHQVYGPWTPTKGIAEVALSEWTTLTPGSEWPSLSTTLASGSGLTPGRPFSPALGLPPIEFSDLGESTSRPMSRAGGDEIKGIDEILAQLEDSEAMRENEANAAYMSQKHDDMKLESKSNSTSASRASPRSESVETPVDNMGGSLAGSPFVTAVSILSATSASSNIPAEPQSDNCIPSRPRHRQTPSMQLTMPTAPFIPPPPMCMFFTPTFRDLQNGKVAVWKGDLTIRGRGGGTFNILIVGEQESDKYWQSHLWGESLAYPPGPSVAESCTATMIPVSTLAREGLLPVTMGMVLCNDENIGDYVSMVQGLHAEGVAFHLPGSTLPIVFLPAKFDSADPLQRLGVAFMTKGGLPPPHLAKPVQTSPETTPKPEPASTSGRKRRRKSSASNTAKGDDTPVKTAARRKGAHGRSRSKTMGELTTLE